MNRYPGSAFTVLLLIGASSLLAQEHVSTLRYDTVYSLIGDTLFANQGIKLYVGQRVVIGKATGERDWFRTISFKSPANWPILMFRNVEIAADPEYESDESIRNNDKVKMHLSQGDTLVVSRIKRFGRQRSGFWHVMWIDKTDGWPPLKFKAYVEKAIALKEIIPLKD